MSRIRDIANILSASTAMATDAEVAASYVPLSSAAANQIMYKNSSNVASGSSGLQYDGTSIKVNGNLESVYTNGDEGGEIFLNKATTNTTITNGVTVDVFQNKLRFFENGGSNRGYYLDIASGGNSAGTNLGSSGGMTLISTTTLTGASVSLTSIPSGYINLQLHIVNFLPATDATSLQFQFNSDTGSNYYRNMTWTGFTSGGGSPSLAASTTVDNSVTTYNFSRITIFNYLNTTSAKLVEYTSINTDPTTTTNVRSASGIQTWDNTAAITSIQLFAASGNLTSGTVLLYGVK